MAISSLTASLNVRASWTASNTITGSDYGTNTNQTNVSKTISLGTAAANAAAGGSDTLYSTVLSIAGAGSSTLDLTSLADILGTSFSFARVKGILIRLLSPTDDSTIGTAASSITVGAAASNQFVGSASTGWFENTTDEVSIPNGGFLAWGVGNAAGITVDSTHKSLKILNNDASVTAKVQVTIIGGTS